MKKTNKPKIIENKNNDEDFSYLLNLPKDQTSKINFNSQFEIINKEENKEKNPFILEDAQKFLFDENFYLNSEFIPDYPLISSDENQNILKPSNMRFLIPEMMKNYDLSTLFYIYFYFPNSIQKKNSEKELKKRGWRYTSYLKTWVHLISEPIESTSNIIKGKFEIFNYENDKWNIEIKELIEISFNIDDLKN